MEDGVYLFRWKLPACAVAQVQAADGEAESLECSRRGACNRKSGECACFRGYYGADCGLQTVVI